ncbi:MAG: hypothetical protein EBS07_09680 [Sphingobacteriia bacterium]|nr:hypothetical protein [Sphingobacteriia bacterium]
MTIKYYIFYVFWFCIITQYCFAQNKLHRMRQGDMLPEIVLHPVFGDSVVFSAFKGKNILITFNRYVSCPLCNFRTHELLEKYDTLRSHGLLIISVYESGRETLTEYTTKEEVPFIMIADPEEYLYRQFKIQRSWWKSFTGLFHAYSAKHSPGKKLFKSSYARDGHLNRIGADFLVDTNGIVQVAYYGKFVGDHLPVSEIVEWVVKN